MSEKQKQTLCDLVDAVIVAQDGALELLEGGTHAPHSSWAPTELVQTVAGEPLGEERKRLLRRGLRKSYVAIEVAEKLREELGCGPRRVRGQEPLG